MAKHAQAQNVKVCTRREGSNILVEVEDDGIGFDAGAVRGRKDLKAGFGLFNVRERLDYFGGSFELDSEPGRGTRVTLLAPLQDKRGA